MLGCGAHLCAVDREHPKIGGGKSLKIKLELRPIKQHILAPAAALVVWSASVESGASIDDIHEAAWAEFPWGEDLEEGDGRGRERKRERDESYQTGLAYH